MTSVATAGRLRLFRYEVRRWTDGIISYLAYAVGPPVRLTDDATVEQPDELFACVATRCPKPPQPLS